MLCAPGRHASQPHAILNDVMNLAVGQLLRWRLTQIRRLWVKRAPDLRLRAAIIAMAHRAAGNKESLAVGVTQISLDGKVFAKTVQGNIFYMRGLAHLPESRAAGKGDRSRSR